MKDLVCYDRQPESVPDSLFRVTLHNPTPPDNWPTPIEKKMRAEDDCQPSEVNIQEQYDWHKSQCVLKAMTEQGPIQKLPLSLVHRFVSRLEQIVSNQM